MGYVSVKWKTPRFVEYANEREKFHTKTDANIQWAEEVSAPPFKKGSGATWGKEEAWEQLGAHQAQFQHLLDALIAGGPTRKQMQVWTEHCNHVRFNTNWDNSSDRTRELAAQRYAATLPALIEHIQRHAAAQGRTFIGETTPSPRPPPPRYFQSITVQDPLDTLYWDLHWFVDSEGQSRLHKCPQCTRYFVQRTVRTQIYCDTPCRLKANPKRRAQNAEYQRTHRATQRERQIKAELKRVSEIKQAFITDTGESPMVEDVLARLHIGRRRWTTLVKWEIEQYGHPQATDLKGDT